MWKFFLINHSCRNVFLKMQRVPECFPRSKRPAEHAFVPLNHAAMGAFPGCDEKTKDIYGYFCFCDSRRFICRQKKISEASLISVNYRQQVQKHVFLTRMQRSCSEASISDVFLLAVADQAALSPCYWTK